MDYLDRALENSSYPALFKLFILLNPISAIILEACPERLPDLQKSIYSLSLSKTDIFSLKSEALKSILIEFSIAPVVRYFVWSSNIYNYNIGIRFQ